MSIPAERLEHNKNGKFQCITCGNRFPWSERIPRTETTKTEDGQTVTSFEGYECGGCVHDRIIADYHALAKKRPKEVREIRQADIDKAEEPRQTTRRRGTLRKPSDRRER